MPADLPGIVRLRDRREALTLRTILTAARTLFAENGYARTSIRAIAAHAGVAPQTLYAHFGSKAGVLTGLVDLLDDEAGILDLLEQTADVTDPEQLLGVFARITRQVRERCGDIVTILRSGAAVSPDIAATQAEGQRRHRLGAEMFLERIRSTGRPVVPRAVDIVVALTSVDVHDSLVVDAGWSYDDYENWLTDTLVTTLLPQ
nr:TetR/AcrR family transcriptional regulator [Kibdelosporangium sp. MJ126-NF4]CEL16423.1 Transcriptional regulator, TetR family [Kibdelosporangium sp. MJ126-NF4]CTQ90375.1 Transcriptional regulator, TetR family [Kibdelosporangium sp. MJ126-NF4]